MNDIVVLASVGAGTAALVLIAVAVFSWRKRRSAIERDFAKVFMTTSEGGKEALIKHYKDRTKCSRREAMRLAVEEWRRENRSWR